MPHQYQDLITVFNATFSDSFNTKLELGGDEPIYLPADSEFNYHRIIFARGFYQSGMHEIAHWCVAGPDRRLLEDFGYWYEPDGRTVEQQQAFEIVEVKPQALEWIFSIAAGIKFNISADNLGGAVSPTADLFAQNVRSQALEYVEKGWQGAHPASRVSCESPNAVKMSDGISCATSASKNFASLLASSGNLQAGSRSTPSRTSIPELFKP